MYYNNCIEKRDSMTKIINYESESVDITKTCCKFLVNNNFSQNTEQENIRLLEEILSNYSLLKMNSWNISIDELGIENWDNLSSILQVLNQHINTLEGREGFFAQYTRCIIYVYSKIKKQEPIEWTKSTDSSLPYNYIFKDDELTELITSKIVPPHEIPINLLNKIKSFYPEKKNPILEK